MLADSSKPSTIELFAASLRAKTLMRSATERGALFKFEPLTCIRLKENKND